MRKVIILLFWKQIVSETVLNLKLGTGDYGCIERRHGMIHDESNSIASLAAVKFSNFPVAEDVKCLSSVLEVLFSMQNRVRTRRFQVRSFRLG